MKQVFFKFTVAACFVLPMQAQVRQMVFEGLKNQEQVANYYNGGAGGGRFDETGKKYAEGGSTGGANYGVTFGGNSLGIIGEDYPDGTGLFANNPSGSTVLSFNNQIKSDSFMNVAGGFATGISFWYSQPFYPISVSIYDGPNATGKLLAKMNLPQSASNCPLDKAGKSLANCWTPIGIAFNGIAKSVDFTDANFSAFDNLTLGTGTPMPLPPFTSTSANCPIPNGVKSLTLEHHIDPSAFRSVFIPSFAPAQLAVFFDPTKEVHTRFEYTSSDNMLRAWSFAVPVGAPPITDPGSDFKSRAIAIAVLPVTKLSYVCSPRPAIAFIGFVQDSTPVYGSMVGLPHWVSFSINPSIAQGKGYNASNIVVVNAGTTSILGDDGAVIFQVPTTTATASPAADTNSRSVQLDGSQSTSADGKPLSYVWTIPPGYPSAAIISGTTATPTVQFGQGKNVYGFQLTVTDSSGNSSSAVVTVNYQGS